MKFHEAIKAIRKEKGISQKELAKAAGVSHITISNFELGRYNDNFINIMKSLGVEMNLISDDNIKRIDH